MTENQVHLADSLDGGHDSIDHGQYSESGRVGPVIKVTRIKEECSVGGLDLKNNSSQDFRRQDSF